MSSSNSVSAPDSVLRAHGLDDSCVDPEIRQERQDRELTIRMKYGDYMVSRRIKIKITTDHAAGGLQDDRQQTL